MTITSSDRRGRARCVSRRGRSGDAAGREAVGERGRPAARAAAVADAPAARLLAIGADRSARRSRRCSPSSSSTGRAPPRPARRPAHRQARALDAPPRCSAIPSRPRSTSTRATGASRPRRFASRRTSGRTGSRRPRSTGEHDGGVSLLRTRISLECLTRTCLPPRGGARVVRFRPFAVTYRADGRDVTACSCPGSRCRSPRDSHGARRRASGSSTPRRRSSRRFDRSPETAPGAVPRRARRARPRGRGARGHGAVAVVVRGRDAAGGDCPRSSARCCRSRRPRGATTRPRGGARSDDLATRLGGVPSPALERRTRALAWGQAPPEPEALDAPRGAGAAALNGGVRA